jgi:hypothetical protein
MKRVIIIFLFAFLLALTAVNAEIKSSIDVHFTYNNQQIQDAVFYARILSCKGISVGGDTIAQLNIEQYDASKMCFWRPDIKTIGGECGNSTCIFSDIPEEFKLAVFIPSLNKVFISPETGIKNIRSAYDADLLSTGDIELKETTSFMMSNAWKDTKQFVGALILILTAEIIFFSVYFSNNSRKNNFLLTVFFANLISVPIVWFASPFISNNTNIVIASAVLFGIIFEGFFIYLLNKKFISIRKSMILSIAANAISLIFGGIINYLFPSVI